MSGPKGHWQDIGFLVELMDLTFAYATAAIMERTSNPLHQYAPPPIRIGTKL